MTTTLDTRADLRALVDGPLHAALDRLDPETRLICGYHLGFWSADGHPGGGGGGKRLRATLALLSASAAGVDPTVGLPAATACELVHNFSLLHDDVMDGDTERRHRPTAWARFGSSPAILAGDGMLALANELLAEAPGPTVSWAVRCLNAATRRLVAGQALDLAFEDRDDVTLEECLQMAADKTGALFACSASLGAVLADAPSRLALGLAEYGDHLGLAFQLVDDLLGIWGEPVRTGKPRWSDLQSRKKSLPVVAAMTGTGAAADRFRALYADRHPLSGDQLEEAADLVEQAGGRAWAERRTEQESALALEALHGLDLPGSVRRELEELSEMLHRRDY